MMSTEQDTRRWVPIGLAGLAGTACLATCAIPLLLTTGVLSGAGWAIAGQRMPGIAVSLTALAALASWRTTRHHTRPTASAGSKTSPGNPSNASPQPTPSPRTVSSRQLHDAQGINAGPLIWRCQAA
jgi:hypothetical protein